MKIPVKVLFNGRRPWRHVLDTCLPALPVGTAAAAFPDILFSSAAQLKMKKRVLLRTKHQTLQVCGGGLAKSSPNHAFDNGLAEFDGVFPQV